MWKKYLGLFLLIILIVVLQVSFLSNIDYLSYLNIVITISSLLLFLLQKKLVFFWFLTTGIILDFFSFNMFGTNLIVFFAIMLISIFLTENLFTNKSIYSFLTITVVANLIYDLYWYIILNIPGPITISQTIINLEIKKLITNLIFGLISFYIVTLLSYRMQSVILIKRKL